MAKPARITLKVILDHLQAFQMQINGRMDKMDKLENRVDRMERNLTAQIDAIDQRLDAVEIEFLPKRVPKLEKAVFSK